jgi:hypothetical protein
MCPVHLGRFPRSLLQGRLSLPQSLTPGISPRSPRIAACLDVDRIPKCECAGSYRVELVSSDLFMANCRVGAIGCFSGLIACQDAGRRPFRLFDRHRPASRARRLSFRRCRVGACQTSTADFQSRPQACAESARRRAACWIHIPNRFRFIRVEERLSRVVPDSDSRMILSIRYGHVQPQA